MLLIPGLGALSNRSLPLRQAKFVWFATATVLALAIGLRHEVGGDWWTYDSHFSWISGLPLSEVLSGGRDPGYYVSSWLIARLGGSIYLLNLLCAAILMCGVTALVRRQPWPWLGLFAAVPYLLIVVGMGYTRQSAAIGLVMVGLAALSDGRTRSFIIWVLLAATFHKTAVLIIPLAALAANRNRVWTTSWVGVTALLGVWLFLADRSEFMWVNYVESDYADAASGAVVRVAMNVVPAVLLLVFRKRLIGNVGQRNLWVWMAVLALLCVPMLVLSKTATDRMALYFIPLQTYVSARLPALAPSVRSRTAIVLSIIFYYLVVQFVWLNFASHAFAWIPYRFMPFWRP